MNLVCRKNEIILTPIVVKAKANDNNDSRIITREIAKIQRVEIDLWSNGILKPSPSFDRFKKVFLLPIHFWMFFTYMLPAFIGEINLMAQSICHKSPHQRIIL